MKILVIDVGGTHVKIYATGYLEAIKVPSGPTLTPPKPLAIGVPQHEFHDIRSEFATIFTFWTLMAAAAPKTRSTHPRSARKARSL